MVMYRQKIDALSFRCADFMLLMVALIWGTSYGVTKEAIALYPVVGFLFIRFSLTFILLLPSLMGHFRSAINLGLPLGLILFAIFLCETFGVSQTSASNAAFLISLCIVFTPFIEWIVFRQRPETVAFVATIVSLIGTFLLTRSSEIDLNIGDLLMIFAAVLRALMVCFTKKLIGNSDVPELALTAVQMGVAGLGSLLLLLITHDTLPTIPLTISFWVSTSYLVLLCTLFAFFAQNYAVRRTTPTRASLLMGSEPLFGALFAALWLDEKLSWAAWAGGLMIIVSTLWATMPRKEKVIPVQA